MEKIKTLLRETSAPFTVLREFAILLAFCALTALVSWPYVTALHDAVVDPGDPYLVSWVLWWDYHQTFNNPLQLFHANTFYPFRYTLAFTEHSYGIALLFFPLFALGFRPLTVHAIAIFLGFATSGYGAFRLARTLTGSYGVAWISGIIFAFGPFRFHYMSHLLYLFSMWIPLLFEALVLFARRRSRKRMVWFGLAFLMTGLSTISWFILSLFPLAVCAAILLTRYKLWRDRQFWVRGGGAVAVATLALLPFMLPYYFVSKLYGFHRRVEEVKDGSALPIHWLSAERRNKFWRGLGDGLPGGYRFKLFPGLLPILLSVVAMATLGRERESNSALGSSGSRVQWAKRLDVLNLFVLSLLILAVGFQKTDAWHGVFLHITRTRVLGFLTITVVVRLLLAYPSSLRIGGERSLVETIRSKQVSEAFWIGSLLFVVGFLYSLGWNSPFYRIFYELFLPFRSMRIPARGAMIGYMGLSLLAGIGCKRIAEILRDSRLQIHMLVCYLIVSGLLLFEFNAAPLQFMRGAVFPDAVTLKLKETPMRGGIVVLPANGDVNHRRMLRAADHAKPLITGTSGFISAYEYQIEELTNKGEITNAFLDLLEEIPASYVVVENDYIAANRRAHYDDMLLRGMNSGRLRFINRFHERTDLYAVIKTEPEARAEELPPALDVFSQQIPPAGLSVKRSSGTLSDSNSLLSYPHFND